MIRRPPRSPLFPYPTLSRSGQQRVHEVDDRRHADLRHEHHVEAVARLLHHVHDVAIHVDRKSTRLNSSHLVISYAVFCLKKKKKKQINNETTTRITNTTTTA